MVAVYNVNV